MFSVTIWRNDTTSENKGKLEFKLKDMKEVRTFEEQLLLPTGPRPFVAWTDVNEIGGILRTASIAKVEIKEDR